MAIPNPNPNIADGIKSDNKTYSSNKIESLISTATELPIPAAGDAGKVLTVNSDADGYELDTHPDPFIYTETERKVGSWIDDSDIYQKTVTLTNQTIPTDSSLVLSIADLVSDVDTVINFEIIAVTGTSKLILPYFYENTSFVKYSTAVAVDNANITLSRGNSNDLVADELIITLRYTKSN